MGLWAVRIKRETITDVHVEADTQEEAEQAVLEGGHDAEGMMFAADVKNEASVMRTIPLDPEDAYGIFLVRPARSGRWTGPGAQSDIVSALQMED